MLLWVDLPLMIESLGPFLCGPGLSSNLKLSKLSRASFRFLFSSFFGSGFFRKFGASRFRIGCGAYRFSSIGFGLVIAFGSFSFDPLFCRKLGGSLFEGFYCWKLGWFLSKRFKVESKSFTGFIAERLGGSQFSLSFNGVVTPISAILGSSEVIMPPTRKLEVFIADIAIS